MVRALLPLRLLTGSTSPPRVTVYVPTFDRPQYLGDCLASLRDQTFGDIRVVVVDNASTADYGWFRDQVIGRDPVGFERRTTNLGAAGNIAELLRRRHGSPLVMVCHDDDLLHPRYLELAVAAFDRTPDLVFVSSVMTPFTGSRPEFPDVSEPDRATFGDAGTLAVSLMEGLLLPFSGVVYRADALPFGEIDLDRYSMVFDRPFLLSLARHGPVEVVDAPLLLYRQHGSQDSRSGVLRAQHLVALFTAYRVALGPDPSPRLLRRLQRAVGAQVVDAYLRLPQRSAAGLLQMLRTCHAVGAVRYRDLAGFLTIRLKARWPW